MNPPGSLDGKRIVVTGAARGLGRDFALHLARLGAAVVAADRLADELERLADPALESAGTITTVCADISDPRQADRIMQVAAERMGGLDVLVNNAAVVALSRRPFQEIPDDEWDRVFAVNVKGAWLCARSAVPLLRRAGGGSIVNLGSEVAFSGSEGLAHYVASKAAVHGLTRVMARELGPDRIRVNAIAPGFIATEGAAGLTGGREYDTTRTPLRRVGEPRDLLGTLTFLVSDASEFVTGQTLLVNGGRLLG